MLEHKILDVVCDGIPVCNEVDLLESKINRMCVTDNFRELLFMRNCALKHIEHIYDINYKRLTESENEQWKNYF